MRYVLAALACSTLLMGHAAHADVMPHYVGWWKDASINAVYEPGSKNFDKDIAEARKHTHAYRLPQIVVHAKPPPAVSKQTSKQDKAAERADQIGGFIASNGASYALPHFPLAGDLGCAAWATKGKVSDVLKNGGSLSNPLLVPINAIISAGDCLFGYSEIQGARDEDKGLIFLVRGPVGHGALIASFVFPPAIIPAMLVSFLANKALDNHLYNEDGKQHRHQAPAMAAAHR